MCLAVIQDMLYKTAVKEGASMWLYVYMWSYWPVFAAFKFLSVNVSFAPFCLGRGEGIFFWGGWWWRLKYSSVYWSLLFLDVYMYMHKFLLCNRLSLIHRACHLGVVYKGWCTQTAEKRDMETRLLMSDLHKEAWISMLKVSIFHGLWLLSLCGFVLSPFC